MQWCIEKTTANERILISNAVHPIFSDLSRAATLLSTVIEECFDSAVPKPLSESEVSWAGDLLQIALDTLFDAITAYRLTVADADAVDVKNFIAAAETSATAITCEVACKNVFDFESSLTCDRRKTITDARIKSCNLDDKAAALALNAILKNEGGKNNA